MSFRIAVVQPIANPIGEDEKNIADAVAFLASPDSTWISGQAIQAAGGYRA